MSRYRVLSSLPLSRVWTLDPQHPEYSKFFLSSFTSDELEKKRSPGVRKVAAPLPRLGPPTKIMLFGDSCV